MGGEEISAMGELAGGAGAARAVEPGHGEKDGHATPTHCLNCGCALQGDYCHCCGQRGEVHFTLGGLIHDIVHGVLHLDGKFWRTLPMLVWKPGKLTHDYVEGKRARYISPIAFYLFTVVAMFALVVSVGEMNPEDVTIGSSATNIETVEEGREKEAELEQALEEMADDSYPGAGGARAGVRSELRAVQKRVAELEAEAAGVPVEEVEDHVVTVDGLTDIIGDQLRKAQKNPSLFFYKVQMKAYKLSWLLIPLSLPFMWMLFPFSRKFGFYRHAVFVTYSLTFMMMFAILMSGVVRLIPNADWVAIPIVAVPLVHIYRQLKGTYDLSRGSALVRTFLLSIMTWVVLALFVALMFVMGALG